MADRMGFIVKPSRRKGQYTMTMPVRNAAVTSSASRKIKDTVATRKEEWQPKAFQLVAEVGEAAYFSHLTASTTMLGDMRPVQWVEAIAEWTPAETDDARVLRVDRALVGPRGGKRELIRRAILHYTIAGEALDLSTPVPTPDGFKTMGDLVEGDVIYGGDGQPCRVTMAHSVLVDRECYEVTLTGGVKVIADANHRWLTSTANQRQLGRWRSDNADDERQRVHDPDGLRPLSSVVTTIEMLETLRGSAEQSNHSIDVSAIEGSHQDLPIDPYVLGYWLGDGTSQQGSITVHTDDQTALREHVEAAGYGWSPRSHPYAVGILGLQAQLRAAGLLNNKHIPAVYLRASVDQRLALLQGLMDSDGHVDRSGRCEYTSFRLDLLLQVRELVASLGLKPGSADRRRIHFKSAGIAVATLPRKAERIQPRRVEDNRRYVKSIEPVKSRPVRCITVDSPDNTFLVTDRFVRTHNSHLVGYPVPVDEGYEPGSNGYLWEFLSTEELKIGASGGGARRIEGQSVDLPDESYIARWHLADPMYSDRPDSSIRHVMRILEELAVLTQLVEAIAKSRLASGLLFLPTDLAFPAADEGGEEDDAGEPEIDEFTASLLAHMKAPVEDRTSASSIVPLVVTGDGDLGAQIRLLDLVPEGRANMDWARELRDEAIERLAAGLDAPPEILSGKGGLNHWTGYSVDRDFVVKHVVPKGEDLADFLTVAYLRPMLVEFEGMDEAEASTWGYEYDATALVANEDEEATARLLHEMGLISDEATVTKSGLEVGDMPDEAERTIRLAIEFIKSAPVTLGPALLNMIPGFENVDTSKMGGDESPGVPGSPNIETPPNQNIGGQEPVPNQSGLVDRLAVAADAIIERAMERAGNRVVSLTKQAKVDVTIRDRVAGVSAAQVLTTLAPGDLRTLGVQPDALFAGAWDVLHNRTRVWVRTHLELQGMKAFAADDAAALAANVLCEKINGYVLDNMHRQLPTFTNGLRISDEVILDALGSVPSGVT